jgi:hypothetical protein
MFTRGSSRPPPDRVRVTRLSRLVVGLISCENTKKQVFAFAVCNFEQRLSWSCTNSLINKVTADTKKNCWSKSEEDLHLFVLKSFLRPLVESAYWLTINTNRFPLKCKHLFDRNKENIFANINHRLSLLKLHSVLNLLILGLSLNILQRSGAKYKFVVI